MATVLVVDDEASLVNIVAFVLKNAGHEVITACDGQEALDKVGGPPAGGALRPDLVVLDLFMPRVDGFAVHAALRKNEATRSVPIIVLTAQKKFELTELFYEGCAPGTAYIKKPFDPNVLRRQVQQMLSACFIWDGDAVHRGDAPVKPPPLDDDEELRWTMR